MRAKVIVDTKSLQQQLGVLKETLSEEDFDRLIDALVSSIAHPEEAQDVHTAAAAPHVD